MQNKLKIAVIGAAAAVGLTSVGAVAQQPNTPTAPVDSQEIMRGGMMANMGEMMKDPEMRRQMGEMMSNCNRMMERMGNMSKMGQTRT